MVFEKLFDSQRRFDEKQINLLKEKYLKKYATISDSILSEKLNELRDSKFDSEKSAKKAFWLGPLGSMQHLKNRNLEAQKLAIKEILTKRNTSVK